MLVRGAETETGMKVKMIEFSPESLTMVCNRNEFQDILSYRMGAIYHTPGYVKTHEEFKTLCSQIQGKAPEFKKVLIEIDSAVVFKETQCFDEGYRAGMADLMTALTFNDLQITHTGIVDFESINAEKANRDSETVKEAGV